MSYDNLLKNSDLIREWNYEKNDFNPEKLLMGSHKKVWWKCEKGHEWEAVISSRANGRKCPYCTNRLLLEGFNDLSSRFPAVLEQWDYDKNKILPNKILYGTKTKVWWKCSHGHSFERAVCNAINENKCPICNNRQILAGYNDLGTTCPDMAKQWDYDKNKLLPSQVMKNSGVKIWWKCKNGHSWYVSPNNRYKNGLITECPACSGRKSWEGVTDILTVKPELLNEWDYDKNKVLPQNITVGSNKKIWWKCNKGHSWNMSPNNRVLKNGDLSKCPICSNKIVLEGYNDLASHNKELIKEWNYVKNKIEPVNVTFSSNKTVWWNCLKCGYEWKTSVYNRNISKTGCPNCAKELQTSFPEQAIFYYIKKFFPDAINGDRHLGVELDIFIPSLKLAIEYDGVRWHSSDKAVKKDNIKNNKCINDGIKLIRVREIGCPDLTNVVTFTFDYKKNYYTNLSNIISSLISYVSNETITVDVKNDENLIYSSFAKNKGEKSLAILRKDLLEEWDYDKNKLIDPHMVTVSSGKKVWWKCKKFSHSWKAIIYSRTKQNGTGCPICSGLVIKQGFNDLKTLRPDLIKKEWDYKSNVDIQPEELPVKSNKKVWWKCEKGHKYMMSVSHKTSGRGCPICCGKQIIKGENDFYTWCQITNNTYLLEEWDFLKNNKLPNEVTKGAKDLIWWKCKKGHSFSAHLYSRTRGDNCPYCSNKHIIKGINDLETINPKLAKEWHPTKNIDLKPDEVGAGCGKKVWWLRKYYDSLTNKTFVFEWEARIVDRNNGRECPYLSKPAKKVFKGFNDLETRFPEIAKQWHPLKNGDKRPSDVLPNGTYRAWWICSSCNNEWQTAVYNRTNGKGCPLCARLKSKKNN